ncbi:phosphopantetheine-binding protein [Ignavibacteriales bacterium]
MENLRTIDNKPGELFLILNQILAYKGKKLEVLPTDEVSLREIGLDSLDLAELTVKIEYKFGVDVFENGLINSFGELYEKLGVNSGNSDVS